VTITGDKLSSGGVAGSGYRAEHGVYRASSAAHPGEDLVVKSYPRSKDKNRNIMETELAVARIAEQAGLDVRAIGFVKMPKTTPGGTAIDAVGIGMRWAQGGFFDENLAKSQQLAQEVASNAASINTKTRTDIATFRDALTGAGWIAVGDTQGFVAPDGTWTPIDFQSYKDASSSMSPAEIKAHNDAQFATYLKGVDDAHAAAISGSFNGYPVKVPTPIP
jgi:hypothetical protein